MLLAKLTLFTTIALFICNCTTNIGTGMIAGGTFGAGAGGVATDVRGALLAGAISAIGGGFIGFALDTQDRKVMEKSSPRTVDRMDRCEPLTLNDVIKLSQNEVDDQSIIAYMNETGSTYNLSQSQIRRLQDAKVSQKVIDYMIDSGR